jgi:hypothetical protein
VGVVLVPGPEEVTWQELMVRMEAVPVVLDMTVR